jgi:NAD(P)-dependent dehydrogenase (short-subunit alcohol dehydrogenase family)
MTERYAAAHATPAGPGDARPTALQIVEDEHLMNAWKGKVILITGASSGIGVETARALYATGAHLFLPVRDVSKGQAVAADIKASHPSSKGAIDVLELDLESLQSVRQCAAAFLSKSQQLNILICNAGTPPHTRHPLTTRLSARQPQVSLSNT